MRILPHTFIVLLLAAMFIGSCTTTPTSPINCIQVVGEVKANSNSATALDLVFVYDSNMTALLPKTGPEWFDKKQALMKGLASGIEVLSVGIPPQKLLSLALPGKASKAVAVYAYTNYQTAAGQPQCNLTPYKNVLIWLTPDSVFCEGK